MIKEYSRDYHILYPIWNILDQKLEMVDCHIIHQLGNIYLELPFKKIELSMLYSEFGRIVIPMNNTAMHDYYCMITTSHDLELKLDYSLIPTSYDYAIEIRDIMNKYNKMSTLSNLVSNDEILLLKSTDYNFSDIETGMISVLMSNRNTRLSPLYNKIWFKETIFSRNFKVIACTELQGKYTDIKILELLNLIRDKYKLFQNIIRPLYLSPFYNNELQ